MIGKKLENTAICIQYIIMRLFVNVVNATSYTHEAFFLRLTFECNYVSWRTYMKVKLRFNLILFLAFERSGWVSHLLNLSFLYRSHFPKIVPTRSNAAFY